MWYSSASALAARPVDDLRDSRETLGEALIYLAACCISMVAAEVMRRRISRRLLAWLLMAPLDPGVGLPPPVSRPAPGTDWDRGVTSTGAGTITHTTGLHGSI